MKIMAEICLNFRLFRFSLQKELKFWENEKWQLEYAWILEDFDDHWKNSWNFEKNGKWQLEYAWILEDFDDHCKNSWNFEKMENDSLNMLEY